MKNKCHYAHGSSELRNKSDVRCNKPLPSNFFTLNEFKKKENLPENFKTVFCVYNSIGIYFNQVPVKMAIIVLLLTIIQN